MIEEERAIRLKERKEERKEERRQKWLDEQEEERQRKRDEELKRFVYLFCFFKEIKPKKTLEIIRNQFIRVHEIFFCFWRCIADRRSLHDLDRF